MYQLYFGREDAGVEFEVVMAVGVDGLLPSEHRWRDGLVGTGGALTRIPGGEEILRDICRGAGKYLLPNPDTRVLIDRDYRFSALGTLAHQYPEEVKETFRQWVAAMNE